MGSSEEIRVISMCSGYGGLDLGLRRVCPGVRTVAFVEREAFAVANLVEKIESEKLDAAPIHTDVKTFPGDLFHHRIHGITAGYPCQPFSSAGRRLGEADERHLWPFIREQVRAIEPLFCFFENVPGHITLGYPTVRRELQELGYEVVEGIFSAEEVGAPHLRKRLFILAYTERGLLWLERGRSGGPCWSEEVESRKHGENREVADTESQRGQRLSAEGSVREVDTSRCGKIVPDATRQLPYRGGPEGKWRTESTNSNRWPPEPNVGRVAHGIADRVDRLRLLGNGVVPATAAKAIWHLIEKAKLNN